MKNLTIEEIEYLQGLLEQEAEGLKQCEAFEDEYKEEIDLGNKCFKKLDEMKYQ